MLAIQPKPNDQGTSCVERDVMASLAANSRADFGQVQPGPLEDFAWHDNLHRFANSAYTRCVKTKRFVNVVTDCLQGGNEQIWVNPRRIPVDIPFDHFTAWMYRTGKDRLSAGRPQLGYHGLSD